MGSGEGRERAEKEEEQRKEKSRDSSSGNHGTQASRSCLYGESQRFNMSHWQAHTYKTKIIIIVVIIIIHVSLCMCCSTHLSETLKLNFVKLQLWGEERKWLMLKESASVWGLTLVNSFLLFLSYFTFLALPQSYIYLTSLTIGIWYLSATFSKEKEEIVVGYWAKDTIYNACLVKEWKKVTPKMKKHSLLTHHLST